MQNCLVALVICALLAADVALWAHDFHRYATGDPLSTRTASSNGGPLTPLQHRPQPGITARSTISSSGTLRTESLVRFSHPVSTLSISEPIRGAASASADFDPQITRLDIVVDGEHLPSVLKRLTAGSVVAVPLPAGTTSVEVMYEATGVTALATNSKPGRALVLATPLQISGPTAESTTIVLQGDRILNVGCWPLHSAPEPCGTQTGNEWQVRTTAAAPVGLVAQVDLPV